MTCISHKTLTRFIVSTFVLLLTPHIARAQFPEIHSYHVDPGAHERDRNIDVTHMKVEVSFDVLKKTVYGKVTHTFKQLQTPVDTVFFDAPGINITKATLDGQPVDYHITPTGVVVHPILLLDMVYMPYLRKKAAEETQKKKPNKGIVPSVGIAPSHQIVFEYTAQPKKGIYFSGFTSSNGTPLTQSRVAEEMIREQIWTQGQGIDNRHWIPMIDDRGDKYITETVVTHNSKHQVLSNGALKSKKVNKDGTTTWHYAMDKPHAGYLLMLAIGEYTVKNSISELGTPMQFWYYPQHPEKLEPTSRYSEAIIDFLSEETGIPYAWGSYSQVMVQDFLYGAMENTSATTFGDFFWVDKKGFQDRNYVTVNAHEATHQWFGDLITGRHDGEQWLQESFATFYPGLFLGSVYGDDELNWYFREQMKGAIAAGKANSLPVRHSEAGSSRHYPKGASVLHMLRHVMGDDPFNRAINHYLLKHQYETVETWDLQKAIIDETGMNMDWFFDQWIHRGGEPIYAVNWSYVADSTSKKPVTVTLEITQKQVQDAVVGLFKMPIWIEFLYANGKSEWRQIMVDQAHHTFHFNTRMIPVTVVFDAGSQVLKTLEMQKTPSEWLWQMQHGSSMLDRYDALVALRGNTEIKDYKTELEQAWNRENFREMRAEIASQWLGLAGAPGQDANDVMLEQFVNSTHASVRKVLFEKLPLQPAFRDLFLQGLKDSSYNNIEFVVDRLWNSAPLRMDATSVGISRAEILQLIQSEHGHLNNLKIKYLECVYQYTLARPYNSAENDAQVYINILKDMAGPYYEFRTRINAMSALKRLGYLDVQLTHNLFDAFLNFNSRLAGPAGELLKYFAQNSANKSLILQQIPLYQTPEQNASVIAQNRLSKLLQ
jgi:aminopeptidase N